MLQQPESTHRMAPDASTTLDVLLFGRPLSSLCIASEMSDIIISPFTRQCDLPEAWNHGWYCLNSRCVCWLVLCQLDTS